MTGKKHKFTLRTPEMDEAKDIQSLFIEEVEAGRMLPRKIKNIQNTIDDWIVAVTDKQVVGCVSLVYFNHSLCEVRSLAVSPDFQGNGLGSKLVNAAVDLARERKMTRVLTLTRSSKLFQRLGFKVDRVMNYPEKVWKDCLQCPLRHQCDEVALIYDLMADKDQSN